MREPSHQLIEGLGGTPVFLLLIGRQLKGYDRNIKLQSLGKASWIILNKLGRAGRAHNKGLGRKPGHGISGSGLKKLCGVFAQIASLKGGVSHGGALVTPLNHGEEQVGIGVALRRMQDIVKPLHGGCDAHGTHMRWALVGPDRELHALSSEVVVPATLVAAGLDIAWASGRTGKTG